jgi:putative endonuclease
MLPLPPPLQVDSSIQDRGEYGELLARYFLERVKGMQLVASNWKTRSGPRGEIDLIVRDKHILVFVEVRARSRAALVSGAFSVNRKKREVLERTFKTYMRGMKKPPRHFRFDIMEVELPPYGCEGVGTLYYYPNVLLFRKDYRLVM